LAEQTYSQSQETIAIYANKLYEIIVTIITLPQQTYSQSLETIRHRKSDKITSKVTKSRHFSMAGDSSFVSKGMKRFAILTLMPHDDVASKPAAPIVATAAADEPPSDAPPPATSESAPTDGAAAAAACGDAIIGTSELAQQVMTVLQGCEYHTMHSGYCSNTCITAVQIETATHSSLNIKV
jgi:hypothetical protein